jgi:hypothetical protein
MRLCNQAACLPHNTPEMVTNSACRNYYASVSRIGNLGNRTYEWVKPWPPREVISSLMLTLNKCEIIKFLDEIGVRRNIKAFVGLYEVSSAVNRRLRDEEENAFAATSMFPYLQG